MMQFHSKFSFLLLLCLMHICIEAKGTEHDEPLVTLDMKQTPIRKVLAEITRQTGVTFSYESSLTKHLLPIDITITAQPLSHCLRILFQKLPVEYIQSGKYIILKKKQKNIVISGFIRDKSSSESLIGASIYDAKSHQGTTSNADGFFSLTLEAGNDVYLNISHVGYDPFIHQIGTRHAASGSAEQPPAISRSGSDRRIYLFSISPNIRYGTYPSQQRPDPTNPGIIRRS